MQYNLKDKISLHPVLFSIFPVLFVFSINSYEVKFLDSLPLIIITLFSVCLIVFCTSTILKNKNAGSFIGSIGVLLFFSYGHVYNLIINYFEVRHFIIILIFIGIFILSLIYFVKTKRKLNNATKIANGIAIILILISVSNIISENIQGNYSLDFMSMNKIEMISPVNNKNPDVYYIILDAYTGNKTLKNYFGYSNNEFISFLEEKNFQVIKNSQSNYPTTTLSLASSLNMKHLECQIYLDSCITPSFSYKLIQNNSIMEKFKKNGYSIINSNSGWPPTSNIQIASENLCSKYSGFLNSEFEISIISNSILNPVYVKLYEENKRQNILCIFSEIIQVHHRFEEPIFVFAHLVIPHHPYIFGPDGESVSPKKLEIGWQGLENDKEGYLNQVKFVNKKIKEVITKIIDESEIPPIIIIQGDHGLKVKIDDWNNPSEKSLREKFSILNAYYFPNYNESIYQNITPVNSFRVVINELFNEENELLPDSSYWLNPGPPSDLIEVTSILKEG